MRALSCILWAAAVASLVGCRAGKPEPDHYAVLGVHQDVELQAVKKAYRAKSLELHPDRHRDKPSEVCSPLVASAHYIGCVKYESVYYTCSMP